jgi:lipopolysaccharide heptosyltransferase II
MKYILKNKLKIFLVRILDAVGYACMSLSKARSRKKLSKDDLPGSFLIVRLDHIGDALLVLSAPKALKQNYPLARVHVLTSSWSAPLFENNPFVDELILYDAPWFSRKAYRGRAHTIGFFKLARILKQKKIEVGLAFRGDLRENFLIFAAGIRHRIGYGITGGGFFLTHEMPYKAGEHQVSRMTSVLGAAGAEPINPAPQFYFTEEEKAIFRKRLESLGVDLNRRGIGFQPDAGTPAKNWPENHIQDFLELCSREMAGSHIFLIGSSKKPLLKSGIDGTQIIDLRGQTSLREVMLLMGSLSVFVGPDSGPAHIACASGVRTIFLYSGTNVFEEWRPLYDEAVVVRHEVPCAPCHRPACNVPGHPCMAGITPRRVLDVIQKQVRGS